MAKQLDPKIAEILKEYGFGKEALWDCHGTWVVYHKFLEQIAAKAGIIFGAPDIIEAKGELKIAAMVVTGQMGDRLEWSVGEAAPSNNKNAYPWAMAEKRAKDRVILKLVGLAGFVYSEEEADDFKASKPAPRPAASADHAKKGNSDTALMKVKATTKEIMGEVQACDDYDTFLAYFESIDQAKLIDCARLTWWNDNEDAKGLRNVIEMKARQFDEQEHGTSSRVAQFLDTIEAKANQEKAA